MPYDHKNTTPDGLPLQRMKPLLEEVNQLHCQKRCMIGSGGGSVGLVDFYLNLIQIFTRPNVFYMYVFFCHLSSMPKYEQLVSEVVL